ncbi:MAG: PhzF family phenazine biosynthesis protein [Planctomycetota bacterium]|nr:PhzF family phenazine biosynthesis protein [Planctomycetota bacterium]
MSDPIPLYRVSAFTRDPFGGNPAAVCLYESLLPDDLMQAIAKDQGLSETAFLVPDGDDWGLRWFTPRVEVNLCGHATLAAACVLMEDVEPDTERVAFSTRSGRLEVSRAPDGGYVLDLPAVPPLPLPGAVPPALLAGLGVTPEAVLDAGENLLVVLPTADAVAALRPDFTHLADLDGRRVIVTAPGDSVDFVSRFFAPSVGVDEDPVTGSAHCTLAPYWADRLGRKRLRARQLSARGGELMVEDRGARVLLTGDAVIVFWGELLLGP